MKVLVTGNKSPIHGGVNGMVHSKPVAASKTVPNVVGNNIATASAALSAQSLGIQATGNVSAGTVSSQSPAAATVVAPYMVVNCVFV